MLETWNAEPWNLGTLEPKNRGTLQLGTSEPWDAGPWNFGGISGTLEPWNLGTLKLWWNFWNPATLEPENLGTLEPWNPGTLEACYSRTWSAGTAEPWSPGTLVPLDAGNLERWMRCAFLSRDS